MLASVYSAGLAGIDGYIVTVESDAKKKIPAFELVGLPDAAVKEAKERVRAACENSGFLFPAMAMTVNLAPADRKKEGSAFDAAILAALLASAGIMNADISDKCITCVYADTNFYFRFPLVKPFFLKLFNLFKHSISA